MVENDHGVELVSAKVSSLRAVQMLYTAYLLLTLAFQRWVYSGEAQQYEVYDRPAADTLAGWREPGDSLFCRCLAGSSQARVCTACIFYTSSFYTSCPSRAGSFTDLSMAGCLLPGLGGFTESPSPWSCRMIIVKRHLIGLGSD